MNCHHIEVFIEATAFSGEMTIVNISGKRHDEHMIKDAHFMIRERWSKRVPEKRKCYLEGVVSCARPRWPPQTSWASG